MSGVSVSEMVYQPNDTASGDRPSMEPHVTYANLLAVTHSCTRIIFSRDLSLWDCECMLDVSVGDVGDVMYISSTQGVGTRIKPNGDKSFDQIRHCSLKSRD